MIYLIDLRLKEVVCAFENIEEVADYCNYHRLHDDIAMNLNDKKRYMLNLIPRERIFVDDAGRIVDPREVDIYKYKKTTQNTKLEKENSFKYGPIPGTGKKKKINIFRHPKTANEKRLSSDPEIQQYIRGKRKPKNLVSSWDNIIKNHEKSWKRQKIARQWMKNLA